MFLPKHLRIYTRIHGNTFQKTVNIILEHYWCKTDNCDSGKVGTFAFLLSLPVWRLHAASVSGNCRSTSFLAFYKGGIGRCTPLNCSQPRVNSGKENRDSSVDIVTKLRAEKLGIRIPVGGERFVSSPKYHHRLWEPPTLLRTRGAIPLLLLYSFILCTVKTLLLRLAQRHDSKWRYIQVFLDHAMQSQEFATTTCRVCLLYL